MQRLTDTAQIILDYLRDGQFRSGQMIGDHLATSRTSVWKHIDNLRANGYVIECKRACGYQLQHPFDPLTTDAILCHLAQWPHVQQLSLTPFVAINSTNDYLKSQGTAARVIQVCVAEQQLKARGRFNRHWHSPFGQNIYFSMAIQLAVPMAELSGLSLVISLAVVNALSDYGLDGEVLGIKWPNDIIFQGKKLAGILIELSGEAHATTDVVIGIGINANMDDAPLDTPWSSLQQVFGVPIQRAQLVASLIRNVYQALLTFQRSGFQPFKNAWQQHHCLQGQLIQLSIPQGRISGICKGIDNQGNIRIEGSDGIIESYGVGEASMHKDVNETGN